MGPYLAQPQTQKKTNKGQNLKQKLRFSFGEMQGWRRNMQDAAICELDIGGGNSLFAVFDGHGGPEVSKFVQRMFVTHLTNSKSYKQQKYKQSLIETYKKVDQILISKQGQQQLSLLRKKSQGTYQGGNVAMGCGCTANVVLITPTKIFTANAGDSRAVLCRKGNATALSFDHKPQNQQQYRRIKNANGQIINGRVNGGLNLSRSFGDFNYKQNKQLGWDQQLISSKPDVTQIQRNPGSDQFILMGCDGIWERYVNDSQPLITRIYNQRKSNIDGINILKALLDFLLAKQTSQEVGCDNMTAILIQFI